MKYKRAFVISDRKNEKIFTYSSSALENEDIVRPIYDTIISYIEKHGDSSTHIINGITPILSEKFEMEEVNEIAEDIKIIVYFSCVDQRIYIYRNTYGHPIKTVDDFYWHCKILMLTSIRNKYSYL